MQKGAKHNLTKIIWVLLGIILLAVTIFGFLRSCNDVVTEDQAAIHIDSAAYYKEQAIAIQQVSDSIVSAVHVKERMDSIDDARYDRNMRVLRKQLLNTKSRIDTVHLIDPVVDSTFTLYEEQYRLQTTKIDSLREDKRILNDAIDSLVSAEAMEDIKQDSMSVQLYAAIYEKNKQISKGKRKERRAYAIGGLIGAVIRSVFK